MNLRRQLLLVSLLLLSLPWAGCQFVREIEGALRQGQEQSLLASAQSMATVLNDKPELLYPNLDRLVEAPDRRPAIYAMPHEQRIIVDGYADGWEEIEARKLRSNLEGSELALNFQAVTRDGRLFLLLKVRDPQVVYHNPALSPQPNGDRLMLRTWRDNRRQDYVIATAAPGRVRAQYASPIDLGTSAGRIRGQWQDSESGYTLELEIPLSITGGRLGFYVINATGEPGEGTETLGNIAPLDSSAPPHLIYTPNALRDTLAPFGRDGWQLEVIDRERWLVASATGAAESERTAEGSGAETFWLLRLLYRSILSRDKLQPVASPPGGGKAAGPEIEAALAGSAAMQRYRDPGQASRTSLAAAAPIYSGAGVVGAVTIRQSSEAYLSLTDQAFNSLLGYSVAAMATAILGLLGFASVLSWRVRALSRAAREVVARDAIALEGFPRSRARDEIGELSRSYADLLERLRQYNDYLRTLSRKLSHELRTPIAVIQSSLENLEQHGTDAEDNEVYLERARGGLARLGNILNAMSEASGLEESIRANKKTPLELVALMQEMCGAYRTVYPTHQLELECKLKRAWTLAAPELLVQALDKFMDNAASFCPAGGKIKLSLAESEDDAHWTISVSNEGPPLPEAMRGQLFNSLVSVRERNPDDTHLGLGLHIVQLIADFHGAAVEIGNLADGSGVYCSISLHKHQETQTLGATGSCSG